MKNYKSLLKIFSLIALVALSFSASAQSSTPRWGANAARNNDNTGRALNYRYIKPTDAAGADTAKLQPNAFTTLIQVNTVLDSIAFTATVTNAYVGDRLLFIATNAAGSGHQLKFVGSNWQVGSGGAAVALTASKRANIEFIFDGTYWVETQRVAQ